jgi:hypothetical protein
MTLGLDRFKHYLVQFDTLLLAASKTENPALYLYKNDGRTKVFMLQGLCKLYAGLHDEKKFLKLKERFKAIEDLLGGVDHYDAFAISFKADKKIPKEIIPFLEKKRKEKMDDLNWMLLKKKWINHDPLRSKKIYKKLENMNWLDAKKEKELITKFYLNAIADINKFYKETGATFTNIEEQIHELRRKIRWLSIYAQALQGAVQFSTKKIIDKKVDKYLTKEIVASPFNKMPAKGKNTDVILLEKKYFLAMSNVIAALGNVKDEGLKIFNTKEAIQATQAVSEDIALSNAYKLHKMNKDGLAVIMKKAKTICIPFFAERNLEKMMGLK